MRPARGSTRWTVLEEGTDIRASCALLVAFLLLFGCGKAPAPEPPKEEPKDQVTEIERTIGSAGGSLVFRDKETQEKLWEVSWESTELEMAGTADFGGKMVKVTGIIYEDGEPASTFKAGVAQSPKGSRVLSLAEGVELISDIEKTTLRCDEVRYMPDDELIEALGGIKVIGELFEIGGLDKIQTDAKLKVVATPGMFREAKQ